MPAVAASVTEDGAGSGIVPENIQAEIIRVEAIGVHCAEQR